MFYASWNLARVLFLLIKHKSSFQNLSLQLLPAISTISCLINFSLKLEIDFSKAKIEEYITQVY